MGSFRLFTGSLAKRPAPLGARLVLGLCVAILLVYLPQAVESRDLDIQDTQSLLGVASAIGLFCFLYGFWPDE